MSTYSKFFRLKKSFQFKRVQNKGVHLKGRYLVLCAYHNDKSNSPKLGVVASRHYGNAIERNRFKRLSREAFRHLRGDFPEGLELVIKPRKRALDASMKQVLDELKELASKPIQKN